MPAKNSLAYGSGSPVYGGGDVAYGGNNQTQYQPERAQHKLEDMSDRYIMAIYERGNSTQLLEGRIDSTAFHNDRERALGFQKVIAQEYDEKVDAISDNADYRKLEDQLGPAWRKSARGAAEFSRDMYASGNQMVYEGLLQKDEAKLAQGRKVLEESVNSYRNGLDNPRLAEWMKNSQEGLKWEGINDDPHRTASELRAYSYVATSTMDQGTAEAFSRKTIEHLAAKDNQTAQEKTQHHLDSAAQHSPNNFQMSQTHIDNDANTQEKLRDITSSIYEKLTLKSSSEEGITSHREKLKQAETGIAATAYAMKNPELYQDHNPSYIVDTVQREARQLQDDGKALQDYVTRLQENLHIPHTKKRDPDGYDFIRHEACMEAFRELGNFRDSMMQHPTPFQGEMSPDERNMLRKACLMERLTHDGTVEAYVEKSSKHEGWNDFTKE